MQPPFVLTAPDTAEGPPALMCSVEMDTTMSVVHLVGELDIATAPLMLTMTQGQIERSHLDLRVDLSGLAFCDVQGLDALWVAHQHLEAAGGRLVLQHPSALLCQIAQIFGMDALFDTPALEMGGSLTRS